MENSKQNNQKQPIRYWYVDITLTSGEVLQFYVKAINILEAYKKADGYADLVSNEKLLNKLKSFKLMV